MFTLYPLNIIKILYNRFISTFLEIRLMAVLTFKSSEFQKFPQILKDYAINTTVIKGNSEKTVCEYLLDLRTFFRFLKYRDTAINMTKSEFEEISILDVDLNTVRAVKQVDILDFLVFSYSRENRATTRMRKLSAIRSFFKYLVVKKGFLEVDPTANIDAPKKAKTLPKYLTYDECVKLLEIVKADEESNTVTRDYAIIVLFLNTGIRLSELTGLNLQSVSSDLSVIKVKGKGNKERIVYLNDMAKSAVGDYLQVRLDPKYIRTSDNALFLSSREQRISVKTIQWMVGKYLDKAGLGYKGLSVHKLRHTAATLMYQSGKVDIRVLKDILGHEQLNTTQIYTHVVDHNIKTAVGNNPLAATKIKKSGFTSTED